MSWTRYKPLLMISRVSLSFFFRRLGWYQMVNPEHGKSFFGRKNCQNNLKNCQKSNSRKKSKPDIRCAVCSHKLVNEEKSEFLNDLASPYAKSVHKLQLFGSDNVTVQEFVNPHNHHFHSVQVKILHTTYSWNIKWQKCVGMSLNGFIFKKIN